MSKLYKENGMISEEGKQVFKETFDSTVQKLLSQAGSETEIRMIASLIHARVGELAFDTIQNISSLDKLSDDEFDQFLKDKYGDDWMQKALPHEELNRLRNYRGLAEFVAKFNEPKNKLNKPGVPVSNLRYK